MFCQLRAHTSPTHTHPQKIISFELISPSSRCNFKYLKLTECEYAVLFELNGGLDDDDDDSETSRAPIRRVRKYFRLSNNFSITIVSHWKTFQFVVRQRASARARDGNIV